MCNMHHVDAKHVPPGDPYINNRTTSQARLQWFESGWNVNFRKTDPKRALLSKTRICECKDCLLNNEAIAPPRVAPFVARTQEL
eukprot:COSAG03_NODE_1155_length_4695_cov_2.105744_2_plen_84_part_00